MSAEPPHWDPLSGWDDEPGTSHARKTADDWGGWPPTGDTGARDATRRRGGRPRSGGPAGWRWPGAWWDHPAIRLGLLGLAVAVAAAALVRPDMAPERQARPALPAVAPGPKAAGPAYAFSRPAGWRDATRALAPRFPGARPDVVLVGPTSGGFSTNLSVVRTGAGPARQPLVALPDAALRQLHAADARLVGHARRLTLAGEPAVAADYALSQVAVASKPARSPATTLATST